jgi:RimJ/RimL family protein N-acetyltransferase
MLQAKSVTNQREPAPGARSEGQAFLIGPSLYFRAPNPQDAVTAASWRGSPFPAPTEVVERALGQRFERGAGAEERNQLLIACRRSDDVPAGSVEMDMAGWRFSEMAFVVDPLAPERVRDQLLAEMVGMIIPWTIEERHVMTVTFAAPAGMPLVEQKVRELGGRQTSRLREMLLVEGERRDQHVYQFLNPDWIAIMGEPAQMPGEPVERATRAPAKARAPIAEDARPCNALLVGERVYLRPLMPADAACAEELSRRETEVVFPEGRWVVNAEAARHSMMQAARDEPPGAMALAVVLRENDLFLGIVGVHHLDWVHRHAETWSELFRSEYRGGGYGTEAKQLMLEYLFDVLDLHMIYSDVSETNPRSAAALRKQGYRLAGYTAWRSFVAGGLGGSWVFDLLASEWRAARQRGNDA